VARTAKDSEQRERLWTTSEDMIQSHKSQV